MSEDRTVSFRLDLATDATSFALMSRHNSMPEFMQAVLVEVTRKLDEYLDVAPTDRTLIGDGLPKWYQGSVASDGEVISYRWSNVEHD